MSVSPQVLLDTTSAWNSAASTWTDITFRYRALTITRGRATNTADIRYKPGQLTVDLRNDDGAMLAEDINRAKIRIQVEVDSNTIHLFTGIVYVPEVVEHWPNSTVRLTCYDALHNFDATEVELDAQAAQSGAELAEAVLDKVGWTDFSITANRAQVAAHAGGRLNPLKLLQDIQIIEQGGLFINASGQLVFDSRDRLNDLSSTPPAVQWGTGGNAMRQPKLDTGARTLATQVRVGDLTVQPDPADGLSAAQQRYGVITRALDDTLVANEPTARDLALHILLISEGPRTRLTQLGVVPHALTDTGEDSFADCFNIDLRDGIAVRMDEERVNSAMLVEAIRWRHEADGVWDGTFQVNQPPALLIFKLGETTSDTRGRLGTNTALGF